MKRLKKILTWTGIIILLLVAGLFITIFARQNLEFDAPLPDVKASTDSAVIARGKYLVYGPAHCSYCHATRPEIEEIKKGNFVPLAGGFNFDLAIGTIYTRNLTPDPETGIGTIPDAQLARALRYGVNHDGRALFAFMPFQNASDEDLTAIISYLRSMPPVKRKIPEPKYNMLGKAINAFLLKPIGPSVTPPRSVKVDSSAEYGKYLVNSIANCRGCHTLRDPMTGDYTGPDFGGGLQFGEADLHGTFTTPNLTPDKATGIIANWSEQAFIARFRRGRFYPTTPMPWESFSNMSESDLKAIYRYLETVAPVSNKIDQVFIPEQPGKK